MTLLTDLVVGLAIGTAVGFLGLKREWLTRSGAITLSAVSFVIFGFGGFIWFLSGLVVFLSGSIFTKYRIQDKEAAYRFFKKGGARDAAQVVANGGVATIIAFISHFVAEKGILLIIYLGTLAAANADTWATEIGVLSKSYPRLITNLKPVERGTSGAISFLGTSAAVLGSLVVSMVGLGLAAISGVFADSDHNFVWQIALPSCFVGGIIGSFVDSFLGATVQAKYYCPVCRHQTEQEVHRCGHNTDFVSGIKWVNNDIVNLLCTIIGAGISYLIYVGLA